VKILPNFVATWLAALGLSLVMLGIAFVPDNRAFADPPPIGCDGPAMCDLLDCQIAFPPCPSLGPGFCKGIAACFACSCRLSVTSNECTCH
jgi:hypothetical protein